MFVTTGVVLGDFVMLRMLAVSFCLFHSCTFPNETIASNIDALALLIVLDSEFLYLLKQ
jgi:hypothetical protein